MISFETAYKTYTETLDQHGQSALNLNNVRIQKEPFNITDAKDKALAGMEWHNNSIRAVASLVSQGWSDPKIHLEMKSWTLSNYTYEQTSQEVQQMIDGARNKGFAPRSDEAGIMGPPLLEHIANIKLTAPQYLIDGLIEEQSLCQIFGDPGSGKSFMAIDMACSIGSGIDFHGKPVSRGPVVYVAGEGRKGVVRRVNAWAKSHSVNLANISLYVSRTAVGINNGNNLADLKAEIRDIVENFTAPALIIIDTLARNFGEGDENDTKDMTKFIAEVDCLNDEFFCASLIVHHAGHGEKARGRGSSALKGALDTEYRITKSDDQIQMSNTKMKDEEPPDPMQFYLISMDIGKDENGDSVSSAVLEFRGVGVSKSARLTKSEYFAVKTFQEAVASLKASSLDLNPQQLHLEQWRESFHKRATQPNPDSKRTAFDRARRDLQSKGWLTVEDDVYTLTPRTPGQSPDKPD